MKGRWVWGAGAMIVAGAVAAWGHPHGAQTSEAGGPLRPFIILHDLPLLPEYYAPETAELVRQGIPAKFGEEEWAAVVLAQELHQHVGIYTILGAKMGVRAREILEAPMRTVKVTMETGKGTPLTCACDGVQAALASTFAQGLIEIDESVPPRIAGRFEYDGKVLRLSLKPEYEQKVAAIIKDASENHGFLSERYFEEIARQSYAVWAEFDRSDLFDEALEGGDPGPADPADGPAEP